MPYLLSCCRLIIITTSVVNFYAPSIMEEVSSLLTNAGFDTEIVQIFVSNKIDRSVLATLTTQDMKELGIVALGDRKNCNFLSIQCREKQGIVCFKPNNAGWMRIQIMTMMVIVKVKGSIITRRWSSEPKSVELKISLHHCSLLSCLPGFLHAVKFLRR